MRSQSGLGGIKFKKLSHVFLELLLEVCAEGVSLPHRATGHGATGPRAGAARSAPGVVGKMGGCSVCVEGDGCVVYSL